MPVPSQVPLTAPSGVTFLAIPENAWRALDPTHNRQIIETYVKIGHRRDCGDVPPVSGNYHGTLERTMPVEVKITPLT